MHLYTVTCETHDEAVVHCLAALSFYAQLGTSERGEEPCIAVPTDHGWDPEGARATFRFRDVLHRNTFLGEATRLLSGKWTRVALTDEEEVEV